MSKTESQLSAEETNALHEHELTISQGLAAFEAVGLALLDVRDRKLYRDDYKTFEAYLCKRWNIGLRRGEQLIEAAKIAEQMRTDGSPLEIENERQARALSSVPPHLRKQVIDRIKESGEKLTEQAVTRATLALLEEVREQIREPAARSAAADEDDSEIERANGAEEGDETATALMEKTLRRAARKVEKPRLYLLRGLEHLRLAVKDLRKIDEEDLDAPTARQALRDGLNAADAAFSDVRLLIAKKDSHEVPSSTT